MIYFLTLLANVTFGRTLPEASLVRPVSAAVVTLFVGIGGGLGDLLFVCRSSFSCIDEVDRLSLDIFHVSLHNLEVTYKL